MKIETFRCDICREIIPRGAVKRIPIVFDTEQTEGRSCKKHLTYNDIHICDKCEGRLVQSFPLIGSGAQGYNSYRWLESDSRKEKE